MLVLAPTQPCSLRLSQSLLALTGLLSRTVLGMTHSIRTNNQLSSGRTVNLFHMDRTDAHPLLTVLHST